MLAEVLDKVELPWDASSIAVAGLVALLCFGLQRIPTQASRIAGAAIAVGWGALRVGLDPYCDAVLGSSLRLELGDGGSLAYLAAMLACALLPIAAFGTAHALARTRREKRASPAPGPK